MCVIFFNYFATNQEKKKYNKYDKYNFQKFTINKFFFWEF